MIRYIIIIVLTTKELSIFFAQCISSRKQKNATPDIYSNSYMNKY